jgi:predicted DCC family thiol-disulfide oxidoreductase YuxK
MDKQPHRIVLFDGVCSVCDQAVLFIVDHDRRRRFSFAPIQSPIGERLLAAHGLSELTKVVSTIVLIEGDRTYTHSAAVVRIARELDRPWPLLSLFWLVPAPLRDAAYRYFAAHRYTWFGQRDSCRVPTPELRSRFLDMDAAT